MWKKALVALGILAGCTSPPLDRPAVVGISAAEAHALVTSRPATQFIDVRERHEFAAGHPSGARNLPLSEIDTWAPGLDKGAGYVMTCRSGRRSAQAAARMQELGVADVKNLGGGYLAWEKAGLPVGKPEGN
ncbi:MAG: rhodanese-like domain-containing protein [Candidatus Sericytochromatia bacterium]|nr:rhodanese-like domain-containing protein [Candidatus Tanganyikabacteria bacterium]